MTASPRVFPLFAAVLVQLANARSQYTCEYAGVDLMNRMVYLETQSGALTSTQIAKYTTYDYYYSNDMKRFNTLLFPELSDASRLSVAQALEVVQRRTCACLITETSNYIENRLSDALFVDSAVQLDANAWADQTWEAMTLYYEQLRMDVAIGASETGTALEIYDRVFTNCVAPHFEYLLN